MRPYGFAKAEYDHELFIDRAHIVFDREFIHPAEIRHRCIIVDDVDAAIGVERELDQCVALVLLCQVGRLERDHFAARLLGVAKRRFRHLSIDVATDDLGAFCTKQQCSGAPHAIAGPGDDANLVFQASRHVLPRKPTPPVRRAALFIIFQSLWFYG